ncbi:MAG: hypothetical protein KatS3mg107_0859 [Gemmataceae bacterium]|nr:MAG: hypothetical protein KatS3mg107_0859 [Gemmataceae bacterium]
MSLTLRDDEGINPTWGFGANSRYFHFFRQDVRIKGKIINPFYQGQMQGRLFELGMGGCQRGPILQGEYRVLDLFPEGSILLIRGHFTVDSG